MKKITSKLPFSFNTRFSSFLPYLFSILISFTIGFNNGKTQTLNITPNAGAYLYAVTGLDLFSPRIATDTSFYWGFSLMGNGEYYPKMERAWPNTPPAPALPKYCWLNYPQSFPGKYQACCFPQPSPASVSFQRSYTYPQGLPPGAGSFDARILPLPRKGDPPPPDFLWLTFPLTGVGNAAGAFTAPIRSVDANRNIHLAHSHGYLNNHVYTAQPSPVGEKSVFIISYRPDNDCPPGKIHLFYGAKWKQTNPKDLSNHVASTHFNISALNINPKYGAVQTGPFIYAPYPNTLFQYHDYFDLTTPYVNNAKAVIAPYNGELRLFREVEFNDPTLRELGPDEWSFALAVITSDQPCSYRNHDELYQALRMSEKPNGVPKLGNEFVVDVDTIYLKSGEPDDPNHLTITRINPCGDGKTRIEFELTFSNVGNNRVQNANVHLNRLAPGCLQNIQFCEPPTTRRKGATLHWNPCDGNLSISMKPGMAPGESDKIRFSYTTDNGSANAVIKCLQSEAVASGDIQFERMDRFYFTNELLDESFSPSEGTDCPCLRYRICLPGWLETTLQIAAGILALLVLAYAASKILTVSNRSKQPK